MSFVLISSTFIHLFLCEQLSAYFVHIYAISFKLRALVNLLVVFFFNFLMFYKMLTYDSLQNVSFLV